MSAEQDATPCVASAGCQRRPAVGHVCRGHFERLASILRDIEEQSRLLNAVPSMAVRNGRSGSLASQRSPAVLDAIVLNDRRSWAYEARTPGPACYYCLHDTCTTIRNWQDARDSGSTEMSSVLALLHSWGRVVREDRYLAAPEQVTVNGERDLLSRHLDWIAEQPWVDELYDAMSRLLAQLKATNNTQDDPPAGTCYLPDENGRECGGNIWRREQQHMAWATLPDRCARTAVKVADGPAYCDRCGNTWDGAALKHLDLILEKQHQPDTRPHTEDGRRMLTAEELVTQGLVSTVSNVRVTAHRKGKRAVGSYYDPRWFESKASA